MWWRRQASAGFVYLKMAVSCDTTSPCSGVIFDSVALVSWMRLWLQLFIHIHICIQADILICWINKTFQVSHLLSVPNNNYESSHNFYWMYHYPEIIFLYCYFSSLIIFIVIIFLFLSFLMFYLYLFFIVISFSLFLLSSFFIYCYFLSFFFFFFVKY